MRCSGLPARNACSRSIDKNKCAPRLVATREWISSMIRVSTDSRIFRVSEVSNKNSDSGVVIRMSGGVRRMRARSTCGVSPVRTASVGTRTVLPKRRAASAIPAIGARRFCSMSTASALSGETYSTRQRVSLAGLGAVHQAIDGRQECRQRLARASGREQQRGGPRQDRGQAQGLRAGGLAQRVLEPVARRGGEFAQGGRSPRPKSTR